MSYDHLTIEELCQRWGYDPTLGQPVKNWISYQLASLKVAQETAEEIKRTHSTYTHHFYSLRMAAMDTWIRENAPEEVKQAYFNIVANGQPSHAGSERPPMSERALYEQALIQIDQLAKERAEKYPSGYANEIRTAMESIDAIKNTADTMKRGELRMHLARIHGVLSMMLPENAGKEVLHAALNAVNSAIAGGAVVTLRPMLPGKAIMRGCATWPDADEVKGPHALGAQSALEHLAAAIEATPEYQASITPCLNKP